jgi:hypothetical protein
MMDMMESALEPPPRGGAIPVIASMRSLRYHCRGGGVWAVCRLPEDSNADPCTSQWSGAESARGLRSTDAPR